MMGTDKKLSQWFAGHLPGAENVQVAAEGLTTGMGFSNETIMLDVSWKDQGGLHDEALVLRAAPAGEGGLLAPYDIGKQFKIMRALEGSAIPVPKMFWLEESDEVLGRPFFIMERLSGTAFEIDVPPPYHEFDDAGKRAMLVQFVQQLSNVSNFDWKAAGIDFLGDGSDSLTAEVKFWEEYFERCDPGKMPGFELMLKWLHENQPEQSEQISLVHGDPKWGNIMWNDRGEVSAFVDWELSGVGDPLMDLAYFLCVLYSQGPSPSPIGTDFSREDVIALYTEQTGLNIHDLAWYEVLELFKLGVITYKMYVMFLAGEVDDLRFLLGGLGVPGYIARAMIIMGEDLTTEVGLPAAPPERIADAVSGVINEMIIPASNTAQAAQQAALVAYSVGVLAQMSTQADAGTGDPKDLVS